MSRPDKEPGGFIWLVGLLDLVFPWIGVPLALAGLFMSVRGYANGWWILLLGVAMLIADLLLTLLWARPAGKRTDEPALNRRSAQYIGRKVLVVESLVGGEGKVRVADTLWRVRGPDCPSGTWVKIVDIEGTCLVVELISEAGDA